MSLNESIYYQNESVVLYKGDCIEILQNLSPQFDACITDPPYGTTVCKWDSIIPFEPMWEHLHRLVKSNGSICVFGSEPFSSALRMSNIERYKYDWIWKKPHTGQLNAHKMPLKNYETISIFYEKPVTYNPQFTEGKPYTIERNNYKGSECYGKQRDHSTVNTGFRYPMQILEFKKDTERLHPTQKPVALLEYLIKTYTEEGDTVLDFCAGSGTTGVACMNTGRKCALIEKEEKYCEIIRDRLTSKMI